MRGDVFLLSLLLLVVGGLPVSVAVPSPPSSVQRSHVRHSHSDSDSGESVVSSSLSPGPDGPDTAIPTTQRYNDSWASLDSRPLPQWYEDAKFGLFIHWGVYSVPSWSPVGEYAEWYWERLINQEDGGVTARFQSSTYGPKSRYQDFAPHFTAELFDADAWADLFKRSGAKYTIPTSKHHEGFTLWPSAQSWNWNAVDIGPHQDLLSAIMTATRKAGLHAGAYFSLYEWFHPFIVANKTKYIEEVMRPQWMDLVQTYQPEVLWCDGDWVATSDEWGIRALLEWTFNDSPTAATIVVDDRLGTDAQRKHGSFYTPEYDDTIYVDHKWETSMGIDLHSYGLNRMTAADQYYNASYLINVLVRTVANGGNLLLDIGPSADGTINSLMAERLLQIGEWLNLNGEAIYATRKWRAQQEGGIDNTTVRYTVSKDGTVVYLHILTWPALGELVAPTPVPNANATVTMLSTGETLQWEPLTPKAGIVVQLPYPNPSTLVSSPIWVLKLSNFS